jgi:hypothetical protein
LFASQFFSSRHRFGLVRLFIKIATKK